MRKYLVIGNPINHSLSPKIHNHWLKENRINATYDKLKLENKEIKGLIQDIKQKKIAGCNVTVPFKKVVIPYLDELSLEAEKTQSVNTIVSKNNTLIGHNTDISGFTRAIKDLNFNIKNKRVFILGAGGVVPSIIFALSKMEVSKIMISNRTRQKAENLKMQFKHLNILDWGKVEDFDVIINATSLGLKNEEINLNYSNFGNDKLFYDVIYNPSETKFLKEGKRLGNKVENGRLMFVYQAYEAFRLWHGLEPKINEHTYKILEDD